MTEPTEIGSSGGSGNDADSGAGGGAVKLVVSGVLTVRWNFECEWGFGRKRIHLMEQEEVQGYVTTETFTGSRKHDGEWREWKRDSYYDGGGGGGRYPSLYNGYLFPYDIDGEWREWE